MKRIVLAVMVISIVALAIGVVLLSGADSAQADGPRDCYCWDASTHRFYWCACPTGRYRPFWGMEPRRGGMR